MEIEYSYLFGLMIYIALLCLMLYPFYLQIGFKPIFYLMLFTHFIYGLGMLFLCLLVIGSYNQLRTTEIGQRLENSIIRNDNVNFEGTDGIQYRYLGESVSFYCKTQVAILEDVSDIVWTHDGLEINASFDRIKFNDEIIGKYSSVLIKNILQVDYGVYSCRIQPHRTRNTSKIVINNAYYHSYQTIRTFYLKRFQPKIERLLVPPGGILQLDIRYHTIPTDEKSSIRYTINQKPINIKDDRTLYTKCSFFVYQYWLLFQYGYFLNQLENSSKGNDLHGIKIIQAKTNYCVNEEFYGTYKFYIQSNIVENSTGRTKLVDFEYPVTYEVVPRRPNLFDSDYFMTPSIVTVTNETSQCWLNATFNYMEYCEDILDMFKSVPALFFTLEIILFIPMLFIAYECFQCYIYFLNIFVKWFYVYMKLETPFQIIKQSRKTKFLAQTNIDYAIKERELIQIYVSFVESDRKEIRKLIKILENILQCEELSEMNVTNQKGPAFETSDNLEDNGDLHDDNFDNPTVKKHVFTRDDGGPGRSDIGSAEKYIDRCNVFIIYASDDYINTCMGIHSVELSFIVEHSSGSSAGCLLLLKSCSQDLNKLISNPYVEYLWRPVISDVAKKNTLKRWIKTVVQCNAFKV
ncbi:hypothetical protein LOTGIDRAFT_156897 [Lottia gigantea]|uniref:Ig-like domain-containing protein n=1 Tax=Lottia gigantea TaxID=225164 RepID=V4B600_LOTGI|nr:hypothetical protein LOTGIDRAFT_156897 [Lottia gigantea]ESP02941.1 hypothetical protein LOTGIDRAFT_156897 [Lottia gigantea]